MTFSEYTSYDGLGLAELVRRGEVTAAELVEASIALIEKHNPALNAVIHRMDDAARGAASGALPDGPFRGVPMLLKDLGFEQAGQPSEGGCRFFTGSIAEADSLLTTRYRDAGVVFVGRTNTPEWGLNATAEPQLHGPTRNPWNLERTSGGSSGGSAAAVTAGIVPLASGGDGGGSLRIPGSCCGLFALKPTRLRVASGGELGDAWNGLACDHIVSRSVRDSAAMLDATAGPSSGDPYAAPHQARPYLDEVAAEPGRLRIAVSTTPHYDVPVDPDCVTAVDAAAALCESLGHDVEAATPTFDARAMHEAWVLVAAVNTLADLKDSIAGMGREPEAGEFEPATLLWAELARDKTPEDVIYAIRDMQRTGRALGRFFEDYDVLITPTLAQPPVPLGTLSTLVETWAEFEGPFMHFMPFTLMFNVTGQPAASVPLHWNDEGLPVGVQFAGRFGDEATLFRLSGQLERAKPWADLHPPIWG